jgi:hypothetical protein
MGRRTRPPGTGGLRKLPVGGPPLARPWPARYRRANVNGPPVARRPAGTGRAGPPVDYWEVRLRDADPLKI